MDDVPVLVADDQLPFRLAAKAVLTRAPGFVAVGEVGDGDEVLDALGRLRPRLVLMDVKMARVDGIEATRRVVAHDPEVTVFLCSTYPLAELPDDAAACGARGYLRKEQLSPEALSDLWGRRHEGGLATV